MREHREMAEPRTSFVGREALCQEVERLVRTTPLVTVTGAGGIGKSHNEFITWSFNCG